MCNTLTVRRDALTLPRPGVVLTAPTVSTDLQQRWDRGQARCGISAGTGACSKELPRHCRTSSNWQMFSDTFNHGHCSKLCWQLSSADANTCSLVRYDGSVAAQRWMLAGAWRGVSLVGLHAASQAPGTPGSAVLTGSAHYRESNRELVELVVSWTVPCSIAAAHRLVSHSLKAPAPVAELAVAVCVMGNTAGGRVSGEAEGFPAAGLP